MIYDILWLAPVSVAEPREPFVSRRNGKTPKNSPPGGASEASICGVIKALQYQRSAAPLNARPMNAASTRHIRVGGILNTLMTWMVMQIGQKQSIDQETEPSVIAAKLGNECLKGRKRRGIRLETPFWDSGKWRLIFSVCAERLIFNEAIFGYSSIHRRLGEMSAYLGSFTPRAMAKQVHSANSHRTRSKDMFVFIPPILAHQ